MADTDQPNHPQDRDDRIERVIEDLLARRARGEPVSDGAILAVNPKLTPELAEALDKMAQIQALRRQAHAEPDLGFPVAIADAIDPEAATLARDAPLRTGSASAAPLGTLRYFGDYELQREIARCGMGVVYKSAKSGLTALSPRALSRNQPGVRAKKAFGRLLSTLSKRGRRCRELQPRCYSSSCYCS